MGREDASVAERAGARGVPEDGVVVDFDALTAFTVRVLEAAGVADADARTTADVLVTTDAWGVFTHGTKLLRGYLRRLQAGGLRPAGRPRIAAEGGAWATVDGDSSLGMVASVFAMNVAIAKARQQGIAYVGVRDSCHFGAAGYYAWLAAEAGLVGLSMANDTPSVAAPGSRGAVTGSNPIAYAFPVGGRRPVILDMSTATVAGGKVYAAREAGRPIPEGWLIDPEGLPTTDSSLYPGRATLTPAAGHKGYGLALLIEVLAGVLTGANITWQVGSWIASDPSRPTFHGAAFLAIDIEVLMPRARYDERIRALVDEIHAAPVADGAHPLVLPGEHEWARYEAAERDGIHLPPDVVASLGEAAELVGLEFETPS